MSLVKPTVIKEVGFDFSWDNQKVWQLPINSTYMSLQDLLWHIHVPFLDLPDEPYALTPLEVITNPEKYSEEYERTIKADLIFPIDIMENKGRWLILDGLHRLMKAYIKNQSLVEVRIISRELIPQITK